MPRVIFIFLVLFYFVLALFSGGNSISNEIESVICLSFIIVLGIPHGAIDNHLFLSKTDTSKFRFYAQYLSLIAVNAVLWLIFPQFSFVLFMLISAFHFGQSQFNHYFEKDSLPQRALYLTWGLAVLSGLIFYNLESLSIIDGLQKAMGFLFVEEAYTYLKIFHYISVSLFAIILAGQGLNGSMKYEKVLLEIIIFGIILFTLFIFPPLVGFSLYFVVLHSMKVMQEEYLYLRGYGYINSMKSFLILLLPYTLVSLFGIAMLIGLIYFDLLNLPYGYLFLILISSITLPHVFVMDRFYN